MTSDLAPVVILWAVVTAVLVTGGVVLGFELGTRRERHRRGAAVSCRQLRLVADTWQALARANVAWSDERRLTTAERAADLHQLVDNHLRANREGR